MNSAKQHTATVLWLVFPEVLTATEVRQRCRERLLRFLREDCQLSERACEIAEEDKGKPYLRFRPGIHFNVSHSGKQALLAFADVPIGVDIEKVRAETDLRVADRIFSETDYAAFVAAGALPQAFCEAWVLKEACLKLSGEGLSGDLRQAGKEGIYYRLPVGEEMRAALCAAEEINIVVRKEDG